MHKVKVMTIFGTRPEAIKMAPLVKVLKSRKEIECIVCVTAQHRQMLDQSRRNEQTNGRSYGRYAFCSNRKQ